MASLHVDFETRSRINLLTDGAYNYAQDESTQVLMMSWAFDDEDVQLWLPSEPFPERIAQYISDGGMIKAFNAQFERLIFWYVLCPDFDVPEPTLEQFYCVAAQARVNNLPGKLENTARALGSNEQKDRRGNELIKLFCIPKGEQFNTPEDYPEEWEEFCEYCIQDTRTERDVSNSMRELTPRELADYQINEYINDRGLKIDRALAGAAVNYAQSEQADLIAEIKRLTQGKIQKPRGKFITEWVYQRLDDEQKRHMHTYKKGERKITFDRNARGRLLSLTDLRPDIREVVESADFAQASSTGKFEAMRKRADVDDDRVRGAFIFAGAGSTQRYSARGLQPHNMPRKGYDRKTADALRLAMIEDRPPEAITRISGDNIMQTLKGLLRYSIKAEPGKTFICGDWAQIEGRVNPWLSMGVNHVATLAAERKLEQYADPDIDVYCETAGDILGRPINKDDPERQGYGKVPELALGFGGGVGAFHAMAAGYGVSMEDSEAERVKTRWRAANLWAQPFWYALQNAAHNAVRNPGEAFTAGRVQYLFQPDYLRGTLWCLLPSERLMCYPETRLEWKENKFGEMSWQLSTLKASWAPKKDETEWPRIDLWGGLLCENVTQATAADILRDALTRLTLEYDAPIVGHTHDEIVIEDADAERWADILRQVMTTPPHWAEGLPLHAELWIDNRYKK